MSLRNWSSLSSPAITVLILSIIEFAYTDWLDSSKNTKSIFVVNHQQLNNQEPYAHGI